MSSFRPNETTATTTTTTDVTNKQTGANNLLPNTLNQQLSFLPSNNDNNSDNNKEHRFNWLPNFRASFHGFSNIPPHQPPPPRLTKIKAPSLPPIALDDERAKNDGNDETDSSRKPHYSPERSNSFERFTQTILSDQNNTKPPNNNFNNLNAYSRPRPRLRQIDDDYTSGIDRGARQYKSKSLYLEVLNRRSFACSVTIDEPVSHLNEEPVITNSRLNVQHTPSDAAAVLKSQQILRNVSGYATLPRRYKPKPNKK